MVDELAKMEGTAYLADGAGRTTILCTVTGVSKSDSPGRTLSGSTSQTTASLRAARTGWRGRDVIDKPHGELQDGRRTADELFVLKPRRFPSLTSLRFPLSRHGVTIPLRKRARSRSGQSRSRTRLEISRLVSAAIQRTPHRHRSATSTNRPQASSGQRAAQPDLATPPPRRRRRLELRG